MKKMNSVFLAEYNSAGDISLAKFNDINEARKILKKTYEKAIESAGEYVIWAELRPNDAHVKIRNTNGIETIGHWAIITDVLEVLN